MTATTGANIRPAASLLMLRDGTRGTEVLLMRRPERGDNDFRSGMCVFPGGVLDRADAQAHALCFGLDDAAASARLGLDRGGRAFQADLAPRVPGQSPYQASRWSIIDDHGSRKMHSD